MENPFEEYFSKTDWNNGQPSLSEDDYRALESGFMNELSNLRRNNNREYKKCFSEYGKKLVGRISALNRLSAEQKPALIGASFARLRQRLKGFDRTTYERELRSAIEAGKRQKMVFDAVAAAINAVKSNPEMAAKDDEPHYVPLYSEEQVRKIYQFLIDKKYIADIEFEKYDYYFSGRGKAPHCGISWIASKTALARFIYALFAGAQKEGSDPNLCKKAEHIFGVKNLKVLYSNAQLAANHENEENMFIGILQ